jgi:hypothetical protein
MGSSHNIRKAPHPKNNTTGAKDFYPPQRLWNGQDSRRKFLGVFEKITFFRLSACGLGWWMPSTTSLCGPLYTPRCDAV